MTLLPGPLTRIAAAPPPAFTVPAPLTAFVMLTLAALAPPVSATLRPPMLAHENVPQSGLLMLRVPPLLSDRSEPLTLRSELPVT